ncbi:MAG: hypothetical protein WAO24_07680 [Peptococcia bacterium]
MLFPTGILTALIVVVAAIVLDTVFGAIKAARDDYDSFNFRLLPKFLATGILPYVGALGILALAATFVGEPFTALFYASAAAVTAKYIAEIKDKLEWIFGIAIKTENGMGEDIDDPDQG